MPKIRIGDYLKDQNVIYKVVLSKQKQLKLKEVLSYNSVSKKWEEGSLLAFNLALFHKIIPKVPKITEAEFKKHQANEQ